MVSLIINISHVTYSYLYLDATCSITHPKSGFMLAFGYGLDLKLFLKFTRTSSSFSTTMHSFDIREASHFVLGATFRIPLVPTL